jgi:DNA (cytosine-5)-methyltransferase 1
MPESPKLITIKDAAKLFGVTPLTLRNWDKNGKLKALRHPMNNYRVYKREDVEKLISDIGSSAVPIRTKAKRAPKKLDVKHLEE